MFTLEAAAVFAASSACGKEQSRRSVAKTICLPQYCRGSCKSVPTRNGLTLLSKRAAHTGPLVTFCLVHPSGRLVCAFRNWRTSPLCERIFTFAAARYRPRKWLDDLNQPHKAAATAAKRVF